MTVPWPDGGMLMVNSATDAIWRETYPAPVFSAGDAIQGAELVHAAAGATTLVELTGLCVGDDPAGYVAFGYWLRLDGDLPASSVMEASAGAFVDGPRFRLTERPTLLASSTARYIGDPTIPAALHTSAERHAARNEAR